MGKNKKKSFTLIEIIVVLIVIAILARIALPRYNKAVEQSRMSEAYSMLKNIHASQMRYAVKNDEYSNSALDIGTPQGKYFTILNTSPSTPLPTNADTNETLAIATRNNLGAGVFPTGYDIAITERGEFYSTFPVVTAAIAASQFALDTTVLSNNAQEDPIVIDDPVVVDPEVITTPDPALLTQAIQALQGQGLDNAQITENLLGQGYTSEQVANALQTLNPPPPPPPDVALIPGLIQNLQGQGLSNVQITEKLLGSGYKIEDINSALGQIGGTPVLAERITQLQAEGRTNEEIIKTLLSEGFSEQEINNALNISNPTEGDSTGIDISLPSDKERVSFPLPEVGEVTIIDGESTGLDTTGK